MSKKKRKPIAISVGRVAKHLTHGQDASDYQGEVHFVFLQNTIVGSTDRRELNEVIFYRAEPYNDHWRFTYETGDWNGQHHDQRDMWENHDTINCYPVRAEQVIHWVPDY